MSIFQISRIQHRRGLQQDLPQLASAELGWSIDQRRLFIGNGTIAEGAPLEGRTEVLTQHSDFIDLLRFYSYKGKAGGYTAQTGFGTVETLRTMQEKFDDYVSVRDFGATGDGHTNDLVAITRAITEIYRRAVVENNPAARRAILFPAGAYNMSGGVAVFPTWLTVVGEGISNTRLVQTDGAQSCVARFSDSSFAYDSTAGAPFITMPTDISIEKMTFQQNSNKDILILDGITNSNFRLVALAGVLNATSWAASKPAKFAGIKFASTKQAAQNITFDSCKFVGVPYAVLSDVASSDIRFNNCLFTVLYAAFKLGESSTSGTTAPTNFRITNSVFKDITNLGIDSYAYVSGVVSTGNSFYNVGNNIGMAINYRDDGNYSVFDYFQSKVIGQVVTNNKKAIVLQANVGLQMGTYTITVGQPVMLVSTAANSTVVSSGIKLPNSGTVNYQIICGGDIRVGALTFMGNSYTDNFSTTSTLNAVGMTISNSVLMYTNPGPIATLNYNINYF